MLSILAMLTDQLVRLDPPTESEVEGFDKIALKSMKTLIPLLDELAMREGDTPS